MNIKMIKSETRFKELKALDTFEYCGNLYMKIPDISALFDVYVGNGITEKRKITYNALQIGKTGPKGCYTGPEYSEFVSTAMVKPVESELTVYAEQK